tara:strand:+ start:151 stop:819 length:669 start_codon:yes stop_codon:yes gene_type:complete
MGNVQAQQNVEDINRLELSNSKLEETNQTLHDNISVLHLKINTQAEKITKEWSATEALVLQNTLLVKKTNELSVELDDAIHTMEQRINTLIHEKTELEKQNEILAGKANDQEENNVILEEEYKLIHTKYIESKRVNIEFQTKLDQVPSLFRKKMELELETAIDRFLEKKVELIEGDMFKEECMQTIMDESILPDFLEEGFCEKVYTCVIDQVITNLKDNIIV